MRKVNSRYAKMYWDILTDDQLSTPALKIIYTILLDRSTYEGRGWSEENYDNFKQWGFANSTARALISKLHQMRYIDRKMLKYRFRSTPLQFYDKDIDKAEKDQVSYMKVL